MCVCRVRQKPWLSVLKTDIRTVVFLTPSILFHPPHKPTTVLDLSQDCLRNKKALAEHQSLVYGAIVELCNNGHYGTSGTLRAKFCFVFLIIQCVLYLFSHCGEMAFLSFY